MIESVAFAAGVGSAAAVTAISIRVLHRLDVFDIPNQRSSHDQPTLRGGGIGVALGALVCLVASYSRLAGSTWQILGSGSIAFGLIGLADDVTHGLKVSVRLLMQFLLALTLLVLLIHVAPQTTVPPVISVLLGTFWMISFVNVYNFMDGINGIGAAQSICAGFAIGLVAWHLHQTTLEILSFSVAAGALGFFPFNFPRARIFLGDVGSYFLGAWLGALVLVGLLASIPFEAIAAPILLFVADAGVTLVQRILRGDPWHEAHRQHVYQRLVGQGFSHGKTTTFVFVVSVVCSALGAVSLTSSIPGRVVADCGIAALVLIYLISPKLTMHFRSLPDRRGSLG